MSSKTRKSSRVILEHEYVPEHRLLSIEEAVQVLKMLGIKPWQLPKISVNDPIARLLKAKPGDIIEITRRSYTAGEAKYYRFVVAYQKGVK
ncbi:DNA-directed RNA polymerase subunit H [Aeropyrum pernix K1]|uniref:DNA-directed RNA polymerase subunit Rpo5 n=1 Tax=Aeropyrum pernix (strain ATCC 700893 / DSM 11879 / JCM 9820 / NBRC 100138 / K1) TaxID=272557 RepID=RPO5_AERPE|nr:DNA-directed RNA polymerase subunit H [Aeropyrum pernix]Q9YAT3.1 RecName: Full=DNA-directed RNA polymerase subunit Rpo5; AltName: Full=DNA-directed RNA polymerase subunit H [Aeropyrum pernix K1]BAA80865.1 DNA-directed RNA polymerase subunit H [Aeropyrum pernix K1]